MGECVEVAKAKGVRLESFDRFEPMKMLPGDESERAEARQVLDNMSARYRTRVKQRSGIWRDLAVRRRKTEIDYSVGMVVTLGREMGMEMRLTSRLVGMIKEIENGQREQDLKNLEELLEIRDRR